MTFEEAVHILSGASLSVAAKDAIGVIVADAQTRQYFTEEEKEAVLKILDLEAKLLGIQAEAIEYSIKEYEQLAVDLIDSTDKMMLDLDAFVDELKKSSDTK